MCHVMCRVSSILLQMIDVIEGTTVNLKIAGNRVAFSIYGNVNSLNGDGWSFQLLSLNDFLGTQYRYCIDWTDGD